MNMVKRITITTKPEILKRIDKMVDGKYIRSRSHAIESLLLKAISKTDLDTVLILAGGEGTRLRPITYEIPKPLIPIHGRPILEHQINMLKKYDIRNILLSTTHMEEKIIEHFGNGSKFGVNITYIKEEKPMGTAGPISLIKDYIKGTFAVMNVDTLMNPNIPEMYEFHRKQGTMATILLVTAEDPTAFGTVKMRGNQILDFIEKPSKKNIPSRLVNAGFHLMEPSIIDYVPRKRFMIEDLFRRLARKNQLSGFIHDGNIFDVGTPEGYERAIKEWKDLQ